MMTWKAYIRQSLPRAFRGFRIVDHFGAVSTRGVRGDPLELGLCQRDGGRWGLDDPRLKVG